MADALKRVVLLGESESDPLVSKEQAEAIRERVLSPDHDEERSVVHE
jgi:hypothetical protein